MTTTTKRKSKSENGAPRKRNSQSSLLVKKDNQKVVTYNPIIQGINTEDYFKLCEKKMNEVSKNESVETIPMKRGDHPDVIGIICQKREKDTGYKSIQVLLVGILSDDGEEIDQTEHEFYLKTKWVIMKNDESEESYVEMKSVKDNSELMKKVTELNSTKITFPSLIWHGLTVDKWEKLKVGSMVIMENLYTTHSSYLNRDKVPYLNYNMNAITPYYIKDNLAMKITSILRNSKFDIRACEKNAAIILPYFSSLNGMDDKLKQPFTTHITLARDGTDYGISFEVNETSGSRSVVAKLLIHYFDEDGEYNPIVVRKMRIFDNKLDCFGIKHPQTLQMLSNKLIVHADMVIIGSVYMPLMELKDENSDLPPVRTMCIDCSTVICQLRKVIQTCGVKVSVEFIKNHLNDVDDITDDMRDTNTLNNNPHPRVINVREWNHDVEILFKCDEIEYYVVSTSMATTEEQLENDIESFNAATVLYALIPASFEKLLMKL